jgi:hypothetical protein
MFGAYLKQSFICALFMIQIWLKNDFDCAPKMLEICFICDPDMLQKCLIHERPAKCMFKKINLFSGGTANIRRNLANKFPSTFEPFLKHFSSTFQLYL